MRQVKIHVAFTMQMLSVKAIEKRKDGNREDELFSIWGALWW